MIFVYSASRFGAGYAVTQARDLAAVIHLCGAGASYAARGFRTSQGQRCGDHDVREYVARVNAMERRFVVLAAQDL